MPTLTPVDPATATGRTKELLEGVLQRSGRVPNLAGAMAHSPAALGGYLGFAAAFLDGVFAPPTRDLVAIAVAQASGCDYTLSAVAALAARSGRTEAEINAARHGRAGDPKSQAAVDFALRLVDLRGHVSEADVAAQRRAGLSDGEIAETVAVVALNLYRAYFNLVARTDIDFPVLRTADLPPAAA
jgi:AhpD family alkylhydroperoxidase